MIELRIDGDKKLLKGMEKITSAQARSDLMARIAEYGVVSTQERFKDEISPDGKPWEKSLRAIEDGGKTLQDKRNLFESMTGDSAPDFAAWGSNIVYAGIHQTGGKTGRGHKVNLVARPYLGISDVDAHAIPMIVQDWLTEALQ